MPRTVLDNNGDYIKSYGLKKLKVSRNFIASVIDDDLKFLIKDDQPVKGDYGEYYDYFERNGFKIIGIQLKNKHIEVPINDMFQGLNIIPESHTSQRIEEDLMSQIQTKTGTGFMSTAIVADRRINFSDQMMIIRNKYDIKKIQQACINARCRWVLIKRLALKHIETGREILNILYEVKKGERQENQELYTAYVETTDGRIEPIDHFNSNQIGFLMENNCHNIYCYQCEKVPVSKSIDTFSCHGQGLFQ